MDIKLLEKLKKAGFPQEPKAGFEEGGFVYEPTSEYILVKEEACSPKVRATLIDWKNGIARGDNLIKIPTLEELIDWCGDGFLCLELQCPFEGKWIAQTKTHECDCKKCKKILKENPEHLAVNWEVAEGKTPKEAVARLGLALHEEV